VTIESCEPSRLAIEANITASGYTMDSAFRFNCIYLELTNRCNCACTFCPQPTMSRPLADMNPALAGRLLREIRASRLAKRVRLHVIGEPSLYPWIFDVLSMAYRLDLAVTLVTNGMLLGSVFGRRLSRQALDELVISIQTPDAHSYRQRKAPISFERYLQGIISFMADAYRRENHSSYLLRFMAASGVDRNEVLQRWRGALGPVLGIDTVQDESTTRPVHQRIEIGPRVALEFWPIIAWPGAVDVERETETTIGACQYCREQLAVLVDGTVTQCCWDSEGRTAMGRVGHDSLCQVLDTRAQQSSSGRNQFCQLCLGQWQRLKQMGVVGTIGGE
jgi:sulfatase maturation enzyme AslB (radical SAM superfamily)